MKMNLLIERKAGHFYVIIISFLINWAQCYHKFEVTMPDVQPKNKESYLCTYKKLPSDASYAYKFKPLANENTAHHMLIFACDKPAHFQASWDCTDASPCRNEERIIYAWAKNAPELELPKHVGVLVGEESMAQYIVVQIHYIRPLKDFETDDSGVLMYLTYNIPKYFSDIYLLSGEHFSIPPKSVGYHVDVACRYRGKTIKPFAFRTHAHTRGRSISAYRIRNGEWSLIGIGDPQQPQAFYNIEPTKRLLIKEGDIVAARCTYDSLESSTAINVGAFSENEMCNFYIMYYGLNSSDGEEEAAPFGCSHVTHKLKFPADSELPLKKSTLPSKQTVLQKSSVAPKNPSETSVSTIPVNAGKTTPTLASVPASATTKTTTTTTTTTRSQNKKPLKQYTPIVDKGWEIKEDIKSRLGEITSIDVTPDDNIVVLHRGDRKLKFESFDEENFFVDGQKPISQDTVLKFNATDGAVLQSYGKNTFYLPGGMAVDNKGMFWVTDLGLHQVFKISPSNFSSVLLTLGTRGVSGSDMQHFCGPFDVVLDGSNNVFVADGYCNSRIVKFSPTGRHVAEFGNRGVLRRPQSLAIDTQHNRLYVMDQGTGSIHVFATNDGAHIMEMESEQSKGHRLTAMAFSSVNEGILFTFDDKGDGHVVSTHSDNILTTWNTGLETGVVSGLCTSKDLKTLFVANKHPSAISKYNIYKGSAKLISFPWSEVTTPPRPSGNVALQKNKDPELDQRLDFTSTGDSTDEDVTIVPAVVVIAVLATPILLVLVALIVQRTHMRRKVQRAVKQRQLQPRPTNKGVCGWCCAPTRYYYDSNRDFDKLVRGSTDDSTDDEEEDLFSRKA